MEDVRDEKNTPLSVGARVMSLPDGPGGNVVAIRPSDADYNDRAERGVFIPPKVVVKWDDGRGPEEFAAREREPGGAFVCEEVWVVV